MDRRSLQHYPGMFDSTPPALSSGLLRVGTLHDTAVATRCQGKGHDEVWKKSPSPLSPHTFPLLRNVAHDALEHFTRNRQKGQRGPSPPTAVLVQYFCCIFDFSSMSRCLIYGFRIIPQQQTQQYKVVAVVLTRVDVHSSSMLIFSCRILHGAALRAVVYTVALL